IAGSKLLDICLVAARPVGRLFGKFSTKDIEHMVQAFLTYHVTYADKINVLSWNLDGQVSLSHLELEIHFLFALDLAHLDLFDHCGTVMRVDNSLANLKNHVDKPLSHLPVYHVYRSGPCACAPYNPEFMRK